MTDLRTNLGAQRLAGEVARHRHNWWKTRAYGPAHSGAVLGEFLGEWEECRVCGVRKDEAKSRRGKTARRRGNDYERSVASRLGLKHTGHFGLKPDAQGDWIVVSCKNGGAFPELPWRWLQELPADAGQLRAVVIGDAPGPGVKRREVIVLDLADFISWYGR
jgi:hypothetical protein